MNMQSVNPEPSAQESKRIAALMRYDIIKSLPSEEFDDLAILAAELCNTPNAAITLLDDTTQWFLSCVGFEAVSAPKELSFCAHAILYDELFLVSDATTNPIFKNNPYVNCENGLRFYAGMPLKTSDGFRIGTLNVTDTQARVITEQQKLSLARMAKQVMRLIEARQNLKTIDQLKQLADQQVDFLKKITNGISSSVAYWDKNLICKFANQEYINLKQKKEHEIIGIHYHEVIPENFLDFFKRQIQKVFKGEKVEFEITRKYGDEKRISTCCYTPDFDDRGMVCGFFTRISDITHIKQSAENLNLIGRIFDQSTNGIFITDANETIESVNQGFIDMTGYTAQDAIGKTPKLLSSGVHDAAFFKQFYQALNTNGQYRGGIWNRKKNGEKFYTLMSVNSIRNSDNELTHYVSTMIDLTESRSIKSKLSITSDLLTRTGRIAKIGGWEYDLISNSFLWSDQTFVIHGLAENEQEPSLDEMLNLYSTEARATLVEAFDACAKSAISFDVELPLINKNKKAIWVKIIGERINQDDVAFKIRGTIQDITISKEAEIHRLHSELEYRNALVREVHHRIKNNLQGVSGILSNYASQNTTMAEAFNEANSQLQSVAVIYGLQGKTGENAVELSQLITAIHQSAANIWHTNIQLNIAENWKPATLIEKETVPLALVINELITNAIKHQSLADSVVISLQYLPVDDAKSHLKDKALISITNNGHYKPKEDKANNINDMHQTGLSLIPSLLPKNGAYICWYFADEKVSVSLELYYPAVKFQL